MDISPRAEYIGTAGCHVSLTRRDRVRGHLRWLGIEESRLKSTSLFLLCREIRSLKTGWTRGEAMA
jgi:hypothetical protein